MFFFDENIEVNTETDRVKHPVKGEGEIINISESGHVTIRYNDWSHECGKLDTMHKFTLAVAIIYKDLELIKYEP